MNKLTFLSLIAAFSFLITTAVQAAPQAYRLSGEPTSNGYAIAWGVKGELTDFDALEVAGDDAIFTFLEAKSVKLANFLVDTTNNTVVSILAENRDENGIYGSIGGISLGNHFYLRLAAGEASGLAANEQVLLISSGMKWWGGISEVIQTRRSMAGTQIVATLRSPQEAMNVQVAALVPTHVSDKMKQCDSTNHVDFDTKTRPNGSRVSTYQVTYCASKQDTSIDIQGEVSLAIVQGQIQMRVLTAEVTYEGTESFD